MAKEQIDDYDKMEQEEEFIGAKASFGAVQKLAVVELDSKKRDQEDVLQAVRGLIGGKVEAKVEKESEVKLTKEEKKKEKKAGVEVTFDPTTDLKGFNTKTAALIKETEEDSPERKILEGAFVTAQEEDEALDEFEADKEKDVVDKLGKTIAKIEVKRGWNEWAGGDETQAKENNFKRKTERAEALRAKKIAELKKKRVDGNMRGVQINDGTGADGAPRDWKFAQKYQVK